MTAKQSDFRALQKLEIRITTSVEQQFAAFRDEMNAFRADMVARMKAEEAATQSALAALAARKQALDLGVMSIMVGSTLAITLAGMQRFVLPFAGVKPSDVLWATVDEYLPLGYGLPQVICRYAGQLEVRIAVPQIALGTTKTINLAITALR